MDMHSGAKRGNEGGDFDAMKRQKTAGPSKVLHVRGLPAYVSELEIKSVVAPFGTLVKCFIMPEKHQAFIQMESVQAAQELLNNLEYSQPSIRAKPIYFQFSSRTEVEAKDGSGGGGMEGGADGASPVILVTISNVTVPVTLDNVVAICKPYGEVQKIITFPKNTDFQALVQMNSVEAAMNAKAFLEGKDLFQGCCHIRVGYSKRNQIMVRENNHKSRDFTGGGGGMGGMGGMGGGMGGMIGGMGAMGPMGAMQGQMGAMGAMGQMMGQQQPPNPYGQQPPGGVYGGMGGGMGQGMPQQQYGGMAMGGMGGAGYGGSPVVLVNKLNADLIQADALFNLFGLYGDVLRVKILYNKRDTAMVQFNSPGQAAAAVQNLAGCPLHGNNMLVAASKHPEVKLPRETEEESGNGLTRDYTSSALHRYKLAPNPPKNINQPSQVLHVANIHDSATAADIRQLFQTAQPHSEVLPVVEFFKSSKKMAYIGMCSVEVAVEALIALHNTKFGNWPIRVSFSPKDPSSLRDEP